MVSLSCAAVAGGALLKIIQLLRADTSSATGDEDGMQAHRIGAPRLMAGAAHEGDDANFARRERRASLDTMLEDVEMTSPGRVIVIGVAGGSGSGKSFYCKQLQSMCQTLSWCALLPHDMYYKDKEQVDAECDGDWDCPE